MKIYPINYTLHLGSFKIHKHCLYWSVFLESLISTLQYFFLTVFIWSADCVNLIFISPFLFQQIVWVESFKHRTYLGDVLVYIAIYRKINLYYLCLFRLFSDLWIVQSWSVNYVSYSRLSEIYGQCWYWRFLEVGILRGVSFNS